MADGVVAANDLPTAIGRHRVVALLASGGMSEIFLGRGPSGQPVVIKRVLPHLARQRSFVTMFLDEARIGSLLHHPNVVEIYELGQVGSDLFLVMELLEGESASSLVRRLVGRHEFLGHGLAAHLVAEACAGLQAAHDLCDEQGQPLGLVHRDVSPQNLFVTYEGDVKVLDFGIATASQRLSHTATGQLKGKFAYMSPEQCRGEPLDARSDVFSLGVVLYEMCKQRRLFARANELLVLKAVCDDPIPRPSRDDPSFPPFLEDICMRALARNRAERYPTAAAMRKDLLAATQFLLGTTDPKRALAAEMQRLFAERIESKTQMVRSVRAGTAPLEMPSTEADESVVVPQANTATPITMATAMPAVEVPPRRHRLGKVLGAAALVVAVVTGVVLAGMVGGDSAEASRPAGAGVPAVADEPAGIARPAPVVVPLAVPIASPPAPAGPTITLHVTSDPAGAEVSVDGAVYGHTPIDVVLAAGDAHPLVEVRSRGYATARKRVAVRKDGELTFTLAKKKAAAPSGGGGDDFHRFD